MSRAPVVILLLSTLLPSPVWAETGLTEGQSGCAVTTDVTNINAPAAGISGSLKVFTDATCSWTVASSPPWITFSPVSATGPATVTYQVAPWTATFERTGVVAFNSWEIVVRQTGVMTQPPGNPPGAPLALNGSVADRVVTLSWQAPTTGGAVDGYLVEIGTTSGATNVGVVGTDRNTTWSYGGLSDGLYFFRVRAQNFSGRSPASNEIELRVAGPASGTPAAPVGLTGTIVNGVLSMAWTSGAGGGSVTGHSVEAGTAPGATNIGTALLGAGTSFQYAGVPPGRYFLRVRATNASGSSAPSNELELTYGVPAAPQNLASRFEDGLLIVSWTPPPGEPPVFYFIDVGSAPGAADIGSFPFAGIELRLPMSAIPAGFPFRVRVRAVATSGAGPPSNEITIIR